MQHPGEIEPVSSSACAESDPFALRVLDDSMEPEFPCGCVIIVDPGGRVRDGAYVLAEVDRRFFLRQLRLIGENACLVPFNRDYPEIETSAGLEAVQGVVTQRAGSRRRDHKRYD